jgi:hypothetical protein
MDRRVPFCAVAAIVCLVLSELAEDQFRGISLAFAGVYVLYTVLFALDEFSHRRRVAAMRRAREAAAERPTSCGGPGHPVP